MPWRVWKAVRKDDPERSKHFIVLAIIGVAMFIGVTWFLSGVTTQNRNKIDEKPDKVDVQAVYRAFVAAQEDKRRACDVVNRRFAALANLLEAQRPSQSRTQYYREHPDEFKQALAYFNQTIHILRPQNCTKAFPIPSFQTIKKRAEKQAQEGGGRQPKGQTKPKSPP